MTAVLIKDNKAIKVELKSATHEHNLHLRNKVEAYMINGIDYKAQYNTHK